MNDKPLYKSKTVWAGITGLVTAAAGYFTGGLNVAEAAQMALTAILGIFIRDGLRS
ncbi:MAG: hypothetical protein AB1641_19745 [Thermodesulfobacteriota bacterium]